MSDRYQLHLGDCLDVLKSLPDGSVDAVITDPPYGLSFMGKRWDASVPSVEVWAECLRVAKPGAHLLSFAGTRTQHRMAVAIEDAGWFIRDMIAWVYGSGFPKSLDVSKAIDRAAGAEREVVGSKYAGFGRHGRTDEEVFGSTCSEHLKHVDITAPATDAAKRWDGWGTALKPSLEPITLARKPLEGTVAENVLEHGTGALNIDGCRVGSTPPAARNAPKKVIRGGRFHSGAEAEKEMSYYNPTQGRWPANLIHDGSEEVVGCFDTGSAARFFYCAKASKADRDEGCEGIPLQAPIHGRADQTGNNKSLHVSNSKTSRANVHPTVKPTDLMRYLCRLVTPPGGIVLDPFMGSGSTGKAALLEGLRFIGVEREEQYLEIAKRRIEREAAQRTLDFGGGNEH